jgi:hypothetical protein
MGGFVSHDISLSSSWRPPLRGLDDAPMDRGALSAAGRGGGAGISRDFSAKGFSSKKLNM